MTATGGWSGDARPAAAPARLTRIMIGMLLGAFAAGLLVYHLIVLPVGGWPDARGRFLIYLAIAGVAVQAFRRSVFKPSARPPDREAVTRLPAPRVMAVAALLGLGAAAGVGFAVTPPLGHVKLVPHDHAVLSLAMPAGARQTPLNTFEAGKVVLHMPTYQTLVVVTWDLGDSFDTQPEIVAGLFIEPGVPASLSSDIALPIGGGLQGRSFWFSRKDDRFLVSLIGCAGRQFTIISGGDAPGHARLHRRMLASARCDADAARDRVRQPFQAVIELPEGWGRIASPAPVLGLAGPDGIMWFRPLLIRPEAVPEALPMLLKAMYEMDGAATRIGSPSRRAGPHGPREVWRFDVEDEGETMPGLVTHWSCAPGRPGLMGVASAAGEESAELVLGYLLSARCPRAGESLPDYPPALPKVIEAFGLEAVKPGTK